MVVFRFGILLVVCFAVTGYAWPQPLLGSEFQVNTYTSSLQVFQAFPSIGIGPAGEFVVVWESYAQDGFGRGIFARRFSSSGSPLDLGESQVNTFTAHSQESASVGVDDSGNYVVVWESQNQDGDSGGIFARRFASSGIPLDPREFQVNVYTSFGQHVPSIGVTPAGDFVVAWMSQEQDGDSSGIFARRFSDSGSPLDPNEFQINSFTTGNQYIPSVGVDDSGNFVVAWQSYGQDGDSLGIFARRFASSGNPLGPNEFQVNTFTVGRQYEPSISVARAGGFVVTWMSQEQDGDSLGVFARRFGSSGSPIDPNDIQVNIFTTAHQLRPSVDLDYSGNFVVAWQSFGQDGDSLGVFARRFASSGNSFDPSEFQVNAFTTGDQGYPAVGVDDFGDFVVAWQSNRNAGSGRGIFAQRGCSSDIDVDGICDSEDIIVTSPLDRATVDCRTPYLLSSRPHIKWERGNYDRFRAVISWNPRFPGKQRITSGERLIRRGMWRPTRKQWRRACRNANPDLFIRVFGVDRNIGKRNPFKRTTSNIVQVDTQ